MEEKGRDEDEGEEIRRKKRRKRGIGRKKGEERKYGGRVRRGSGEEDMEKIEEEKNRGEYKKEVGG